MSIIAGGRRVLRAVAACVDLPPELFTGPAEDVVEPFQERIARSREAMQVCGGCAVRAACLEEALTWPLSAQIGVRGGLSASARREEIRRRRREDSARVERMRRSWSAQLAAVVSSASSLEGAA